MGYKLSVDLNAVNEAADLLGWSRKDGFWIDKDGHVLRKAATEPAKDLHSEGFFRPDEHYLSLLIFVDLFEEVFGSRHSIVWSGMACTIKVSYQGASASVKSGLGSTNLDILRLLTKFWKALKAHGVVS